MKYPKSIYFIYICDFFEKLGWYNTLTLVSLYATEILQYSEETGIVVFHTYNMLGNVFPLVGAIIADSWLGKYRTLKYVIIISALAQFILIASSTSWFHLPVREISILGLIAAVFGGGSYKACMPSFGSDQFKQPGLEAGLTTFVSILYVIQTASLMSSGFITPILRKDVTCFGANSCYPLVFLFSSIVSIMAVVIFICSKSMYEIKKPEGNIVLKVTKCTFHAIAHKVKSVEKRSHWLDHADDKYDRQLIEDIKAVIGTLKLYLPLMVYWSVHSQQSSRWIFQATRMNGETLGYFIKPDQFHLTDPILFLMFVPTLQYIIYPIIEKYFFINTPLRKITLGGMLVATAFLTSGILELKIEPTYAIQPSTGLGQIHVFNTINCPASLTVGNETKKLDALGLYQDLTIPTTGNTSLNFNVDIKCPLSAHRKFSGYIQAEEKKSLSYLLSYGGLHLGFEDPLKKSVSGDPSIRALILSDAGEATNLNLSISGKNTYYLHLPANAIVTDFIEVTHDSYEISVNGDQVENNVPLGNGGVYTIVGRVTKASKAVRTVAVVPPNSVHIFWQLPQYVILASGEVMVALIGLEFAMRQAPASMKSVVVAAWYFYTGVGNFIVIVVTEARIFERKVFEFFMFAGLLYIDMIIFAILAKFYKYDDNSPKKYDDNSSKKISVQKEKSEKL